MTCTLARALRLPAAALDIDGGPDFRARDASGPAEAASRAQAATAQNGGTRVRVLVFPRGRGGIAGRDRQILGQLAPSLAAAAEAVRLGRALESHGYAPSPRSPRSSAGCGATCTMASARCSPGCA